MAAEWIFEPVDDSPGWVLNGGTDGDAGNLGLTGGAEFSTNVPPVNCDCGHSLFLPGTNGVAGAVSINHYDPLAWEEKFSILAWVRRGGEVGENLSARIFSDADSTSLTNTTSGVEFRFSGNSGTLALRINGVEVGTTVGGIAPMNGEWHHVAVVYDGTRPATNYATRNVHFYEDGVQRGVGSILQDAAPAFNGVPVVLGNASSSRTAANLLAGNIDDVLLIPGWAPDPVGNGNTNEFIRCFMEGNDDIFPPILVVPASVAAEAGECLEPVSVALGSVVAQDECGSVLVTNDAPALFEVGTTRVTWSARDPAGNETTALQTVTVYPSLSGDCDGDDLTDYEEEMELGTDSTLWDTDGDGWGDDEELEMGFDPTRPNDYPRVTIHAIHYNPSGTDTGKEWVELYSASSRDVDLGGMQLQVGRPTGWSTVLAFPTNTILSPGHFLLIGESLVTNANLTATLDIPNAWTNEPSSGLRLVRGSATRSVDTVFIGGGFPLNSAGLDLAGWNGTNSVWAHAGCILERRLPGLDNDSHVDWLESPAREGRTQALDFDYDGDGISDGDEWTGALTGGFGPTNPWNPDTDGDGLPDTIECLPQGTNSNSRGHSRETQPTGTNPNRWDTDGDIWPWMPPGTLPEDWPGSDAWELLHDMDPLVADENDNNFSDIWELMVGLEVLQNGGDTDGDGIDDLAELLQNSNPLKATDAQPHPYVVYFESSLPGWINGAPDNDVGIGGYVRTCFLGVVNPLGVCVSVEEGNVSEDYTLTWDCAKFIGEFIDDNNPGVRYSSAILAPGASLLVRDSALRPDYTNTPGGEYSIDVFHATLVPDWNHDRKIDLSDCVASWFSDQPFRFWINDDNDYSWRSYAWGDEDRPNQWFHPDCMDTKVDGICDLLDFFPVWIDAGDILSILPDGIKCGLRQDAGALNAVYTTLDKASAGRFLTTPLNTGFGVNFDSPPQSASGLKVVGRGVTLPDNFVQQIMEGKGILMCEGRRESEVPLVFEVKLHGRPIFATPMQLSLSSVESMYRSLSFRSGNVPNTSSIPEPGNYPDVLCNGKNVLFLHGFSVDENAARAWNAEMFKRLYQSGSRAKFWGMTWDGDLGWGSLGEAFHYHENVTNAFATAPAFATCLNGIPGEKIVLAHSLGNMVVSEAIQTNGLVVDKYFMLNAAIPSESFDASAFEDTPMNNPLVHPEWVAYTNVTWAAKWHELFPSGDDRSRLTWIDRFRDVPDKTTVYNYYSSGDEVFELNPDGVGLLSGIMGSFNRYAWQKQEVFKGTSVTVGTTWAGWGLRLAPFSHTDPFYTPTEANEIARTNKYHFCYTPLFWPSPSFMFNSVITTNQQNEILAKGIPALSAATGRTEVFPTQAVDMNDDARWKNGWGRTKVAFGTRWLHSDIKDMAYCFVYKLIDKLVEDGGLK